jgi:hypothetical protein
VKPSPNVIFQEVEGELVLLDLDGEHYFSLDEVGGRVWLLLVEYDGDVESIVMAMLDEFDVEEQTLRRDIDALLGQLRAAGLLAAA